MPNRSLDHRLRRPLGPRPAVATAQVPVPLVWLGVVALSATFWICLITVVL